jgi:hypothetical protein
MAKGIVQKHLIIQSIMAIDQVTKKSLSLPKKF